MTVPKIVLQQDETDCGVACLLSVIRYHGGYNTLENLRRLSGSNVTGTTLLGLYTAACQTGFTASGCEADMTALAAHQEPCILHVVKDDVLEHYVVYYGTMAKRDGLRFIIGDPAEGMQYLTEQELNKLWRSGNCLVLSPGPAFEKVSDIKKIKKKWITALVKADLPLLSIAAGLGVAIAVLGLAMSIFCQRLIDDILPGRNFTKLNLGVLLLFFLLFVKEGLSYIRQYFLLSQSRNFNTRIADFFYTHLLRLPKPFFDSRKIGELTARLNDTGRIQKVISQLAGNVIIDTLVVLVSVGFIFRYSAVLGIACLVSIPLFYSLVYFHGSRILAGQRDIMSGYARAEANYISTLQGIEPIKNHNKQTLFSDTNRSIYQKYQENIFSLGKVQLRLSFLANNFVAVFMCFILLYSAYQVFHGQLKPGELIALAGMSSTLFPGVANLALISIPLAEARVAFDRMFEFTSAPAEDDSNENPLLSFESLQVKNLSFRFAGRRQLLKNISFDVKKGEIIALLGEIGCGKSTLANILQKSYTPEAGSITVNAIRRLDGIGFEAWRNITGIVAQSGHLFNGTVLENIAFDDAKTKSEEIVQFLQDNGFASFINSLPQSFMTIVGEEGVNLSGGQRQMIALARALYHKPQLLILDEASSAMDRETEHFMVRLLTKLKHEMAIVFITHKLQIVRSMCNRIYIIENGTTAVAGSHEALMQSDNVYSRYWNDLELQKAL